MYEDHIMRLAQQMRLGQQQQGLGSLGQKQQPLEKLRRMGRGATQGQAPWESSEGLSQAENIEREFNKFQVRRNEPTARASEQKVFDSYRRQGIWPWRLDSVPSVNFEGGKQDIEGWYVDPWKKEAMMSTGITNPNLGGYKVMNASDLTGNYGWLDRLRRWLFNDPYDKESDESLYQGTGQDKLEEDELLDQLGGKSDPLEGALPGGMMGSPHEPNPWLADEYNEDLLEQEKMNKWIEDNNIGPEDLRMEPYLEANRGGIIGLI